MKSEADPRWMTLVDTNVLLDIATNDPVWASLSLYQLDCSFYPQPGFDQRGDLRRILDWYTQIEEVEQVLLATGLELRAIRDRHLADKVFQRYRAQRGSRTGVLPDFFIGAHGRGWVALADARPAAL
jgi:predicted nucleic acid-binding protein